MELVRVGLVEEGLGTRRAPSDLNCSNIDNYMSFSMNWSVIAPFLSLSLSLSLSVSLSLSLFLNYLECLAVEVRGLKVVMGMVDWEVGMYLEAEIVCQPIRQNFSSSTFLFFICE